jgi:RNA-directed DNA polymerase
VIGDRVVQTAAWLILPPIFEADLEPPAYGYRPGRTARAAVQEVHRARWAGHPEVIDADVSNYFDTVPPADLLKSLARRLRDRRMLRMRKRWRKTPVAERTEGGGWRLSGGKRATRGTPQGGVMSPLIANVYMNRDLKGFRLRGLDRRSGARLVTDADDIVVLCRYGATEVLAQSRRWFAQIGLTLNAQKTRVCDGRREAFTFLGYTFGPMRSRKTGHAYLGAAPAKKAGKRVKGRIRPILRPGHPAPWDEGKAELNRVWRGWATYFSYGTRFMAYRAVDNDVWERARYFLGRRHQVPSRGTERYSGDVVFGELGVFRRRRFALASPAHARCDTRPRAGCGTTARPVR